MGALFIIGWNAVWTSLIMLFIKYCLRIPLRMNEEQLLVGDYAIHGEEPYIFIFSEDQHKTLLFGDGQRSPDEEEGIIMGQPPSHVNDKAVVEAPKKSSGSGSGSQEIKRD